MDSKNNLYTYHIFARKIQRPIFFNFPGRGQPLFSNFHSMGPPIIKKNDAAVPGGNENISGTALTKQCFLHKIQQVKGFKPVFAILDEIFIGPRSAINRAPDS